MHADLNPRIAVDAAQRNAMHSGSLEPTQRGAARSAKTQSPSRRGLVPSQLIFAVEPRE